MAKPLLVIVPTRGRPQNAARLTKVFEKTGSLNADLAFVADHDDPELPAYLRVVSRLLIHGREDGTGRGMTASLNWAVSLYADRYDHFGFMGDDHLPRTAGWDAHVLGALNVGGPQVVYGDDLLQGENLPTAAFMPARMVRALGWMAPPVLRHLYVDNFWLELGQALGSLRYLPEIVIEHIHPAAGKTPMDAGYSAVNAPEADDADRRAWLEFRNGGGFADALRRVREEYRDDARTAA